MTHDDPPPMTKEEVIARASRLELFKFSLGYTYQEGDGDFVLYIHALPGSTRWVAFYRGGIWYGRHERNDPEPGSLERQHLQVWREAVTPLVDCWVRASSLWNRSRDGTPPGIEELLRQSP